jgi:hypothetical protein
VGAELVRVYDLRDQHELLSQMQETSLAPGDGGLAPVPLVGSDDWWRAVEAGALAHRLIEGRITRVYWAGMADWPEFELQDAGGHRTTWTREGDVRRYVEGLAARVALVDHPWKTPDQTLGTHSRVTVALWVERSELRSAGVAPGPGGAGYRLARGRHGPALHHLLMPSRAQADGVAGHLEREARDVRVCGAGTASSWIVQVWSSSPDAARAETSDLAALAHRFGGSYDGGEVVEGEVWGAGGP